MVCGDALLSISKAVYVHYTTRYLHFYSIQCPQRPAAQYDKVLVGKNPAT